MAFHTPAINRSRRRAGLPRARSRGFTLFESLAAGVVLAIIMAGLGDAFVARYQQVVAVQQTGQAIALARELMDEIASKPLANPVGGSTTPSAAPSAPSSTTQPTTYSRSTFVDVGQYNGYIDSGQDVYTLGGTDVAVTGAQSYTRKVTVTQNAKPSGDASSPGTDFGLVTVTVTTPTGSTIQLQRVIPNYTFTR